MSLAAQIAEKRKENRRVISISEWGDDDAPMQLYSGPITAGDINKLQRKHKDFLANQTIDAMVDLIILKAETKDGEKAFTLEDKPTLMREPLNTISTLAAQMFGDVESIEEHEKN
jgi:hypothetical protein